ncbi:hypothetical protein CEXT_773811 [Caerostris extrusa]|uniref:Uncharacterized protein n=1 Tax=Caerostris extrusa TaxID=172846 RepID=A0AAV4N2B0_CAEEX|nr:hypothetical protein CEXT_773811 [Caerostris extrusa]
MIDPDILMKYNPGEKTHEPLLRLPRSDESLFINASLPRGWRGRNGQQMITDYQKEEHPYFLDESSFCREGSSFTKIISKGGFVNFGNERYFVFDKSVSE